MVDLRFLYESPLKRGYDFIRNGDPDELRAYGNKVAYVLAGVPIVGDVIRAVNGYRQIEDYLENTGLSWSDIEYPGTGIAGMSSVGSVMNFVSSNIERLYR